MHEPVRVEAELLHGPGHECAEKVRAGHVGVLAEPGREPVRAARGLRHPTDAGWQIEHALALEDRELAEEEERFARRGGDPVRVAAAGVEIRDGRCLGSLAGRLREEVLDLERAQALVFPKLHDVHFSS